MSAGLTNVQWLRLKTGDKILWQTSANPWMVVGKVKVPRGYPSTFPSIHVRTDSSNGLLLMNQGNEYEPQFIVCSYRSGWSKA